ncbi:hypothetical protein D3C73_1302890 [compost metagenome]
MVRLKPSIRALKPDWSGNPCMVIPRPIAMVLASSIKGMVGFLAIAPHSTISGGSSRRGLKW